MASMAPMIRLTLSGDHCRSNISLRLGRSHCRLTSWSADRVDQVLGSSTVGGGGGRGEEKEEEDEEDEEEEEEEDEEEDTDACKVNPLAMVLIQYINKMNVV